MEKEVIREKFKVKSSLINYLVYDYQKEELDVKYKRGKHKGNTRTYTNISQAELKEILESDSPGKQLLKLIGKKKGNSDGLWGYFVEKIKKAYS